MSAGFGEYLVKFKKLQSFIFNDLTRSTTRAQANFLVATGAFNAIEILGSYCPAKTRKKKDGFDFVFEHLLPEPYMKIWKKLDDITEKGAYAVLRCGMTHEYLVETYTLKDKTSSISFQILGVNNEAEFLHDVLTKDCGLEIIELEADNYLLSVYNPRLIYDLATAFEILKKKLINNEGDYRDKFLAWCKHIKLERLE